MGKDNKKRREEKKKRQQAKLSEERNPIVKLRMERKKYSESWSSVNSDKFERDGHYDWMASLIGGLERVLEIGTGDGRGTCALLKAGHCVVSIDENPMCLTSAEERIRSAGFKVAYKKREQVRQRGDGYEVSYAPLSEVVPLVTGSALLIEGDVLNDPALLAWLHEQPRFDAVVCWLMGTHQARPFDAALKPLHIQDARGYRLLVQNKVYVLADMVLRSGGVLQVVDRGESLANANNLVRADRLASHQEQASVTSLQVDPNIVDRPYEEPAAAGGIRMGVSLPTSGRVPDMEKKTLASIISRKP